jgi:hypothetical protein
MHAELGPSTTRETQCDECEKWFPLSGWWLPDGFLVAEGSGLLRHCPRDCGCFCSPECFVDHQAHCGDDEEEELEELPAWPTVQ